MGLCLAYFIQPLVAIQEKTIITVLGFFYYYYYWHCHYTVFSVGTSVTTTGSSTCTGQALNAEYREQHPLAKAQQNMQTYAKNVQGQKLSNTNWGNENKEDVLML